MPQISVELDVLIVGAGPVGLFLANECARRGLRFRIVEGRPSQSIHSKALAIFPRTLEIFDMAGVVAPFLERANRVTSSAVMTHRRTLARMPFTPEESPYRFIAMVPQDMTEKLLVERLEQRGGAVEYNTSFVSAEQHEEYVDAILDHQGEHTRVTTSFVVGCDGAHSVVRRLLRLPFDGAEYENTFLLADVETNGLAADQMQLWPGEAGPLAIFPMSATRCRIVVMVESQEGEAPALDVVREVLTDRGPRDLEARELHWSSYFRIHRRHVAQLRVNRVFLAGDAAHIHSPFGGQGMNTGLHDVWNLAWKLDLFQRGLGNQRLLDSYSAERIPVIKEVIRLTDRLTRALGTPNKLAQVLRNTFIPVVSRLPRFQHSFVAMLSELGIAYGGSPIIEGAGKRYLEDSMRGGKGICSRFLLLINEDTTSDVLTTATQMCESFADILELRLSQAPGLSLVRPDGYAAYSSSGKEIVAALHSVALVLDRQTARNWAGNIATQGLLDNGTLPSWLTRPN
jgi:2-polyprenyl-6-methoxyphenol hydroxylase-like FAD-dependent oxidoreductase